MTSHLLFPANLPSNILEQIIPYLTCRDIFNFQLSCKTFHETTLSLQIRWTLELTIPLSWKTESRIVPHNLPKHWESLAKFILTMNNSPFWCVKKVVINYLLEEAFTSLDANLSLNFNPKLLSYLELFYNISQYSLEVILKDNRLNLYRGDPLRQCILRLNILHT